MNTDALLLMSITMITVTGFTAYFFYRILTAKPNAEPDSYSENDDVPR